MLPQLSPGPQLSPSHQRSLDSSQGHQSPWSLGDGVEHSDEVLAERHHRGQLGFPQEKALMWSIHTHTCTCDSSVCARVRMMLCEISMYMYV